MELFDQNNVKKIKKKTSSLFIKIKRKLTILTVAAESVCWCVLVFFMNLILPFCPAQRMRMFMSECLCMCRVCLGGSYEIHSMMFFLL